MSSRYERSMKKIKKEKTKKRKKFIKALLTILIITSIIILIWGKFIEPNMLTTNDKKITNENIPENFNGLKIVHFSDFVCSGISCPFKT